MASFSNALETASCSAQVASIAAARSTAALASSTAAARSCALGAPASTIACNAAARSARLLPKCSMAMVSKLERSAGGFAQVLGNAFINDTSTHLSFKKGSSAAKCASPAPSSPSASGLKCSVMAFCISPSLPVASFNSLSPSRLAFSLSCNASFAHCVAAAASSSFALFSFVSAVAWLKADSAMDTFASSSSCAPSSSLILAPSTSTAS
mmetsp:Transcript_107299/g.308707  ORF Transcript_107299/g.308707 Transcript_107299/m.308707 type:complete len:210 (+) Transcript_107299:319-948(+)